MSQSWGCVFGYGVALSPGDDLARGPWMPAAGLRSLLIETRATILVQAIPSDAARSAIACEQVLDAFAEGADVVTATKSHLVTRWKEIEEAGLTSRRAIRVSAAAGAALPMVDVSRRALRGYPCVGVRGSFNGTSNFVLNEMSNGATLGEALGRAQAEGIAEPIRRPI